MIKRLGDTQWGSHYNILTSLITMFSSIVNVLETIVDSGSSSEQKYEAHILMNSILSFDFIFNMHLMKNRVEVFYVVIDIYAISKVE